MKKLNTLLFLIFAVITMSYADLNPKTCTENEIRIAINEAFGNTNDTDVANSLRTNKIISILSSNNRFRTISLELDDAISSRGIKIGCWSLCYSFPKSSEIERKENGADIYYSQIFEIAKRMKIDMTSGKVVKIENLDDFAIIISEAVKLNKKCCFGIAWFENVFKALQNNSVKGIKKYLRSQGKSFVTKDGINPCEEYMHRLNSALNAPRLSGLDEWFKSVGCNKLDLSGLLSESDVEKLKNDLLYGEVDMNKRYEVILRICLGVEGYNKFVKEYNGDNK